MRYQRVFFICAFALQACATVSTNIPDIDAAALSKERAAQEKVLFESMQARGRRLNAITAKILSTNAELCEKTRPDIGVTTQSLKSYPKKMRDAAAREMGLKDAPSIVYIRDKSPAAKAGLKIGDIVLSTSGTPVSIPSQAMNDTMADNDQITVRRDGKSLTLPIAPETFCDYALKLKMSTEINAYASGRKITVTAGMMDFVKSDNELAYIIGHELAHNNLGHIPKIVTNTVLSLFSTRYTRPFEAEADYAGLYYMSRAGYDMTDIEDFWRRLSLVSPKSINEAKSHPTFPARTLAIGLARDEIMDKKRRGIALIPEPRVKSGQNLQAEAVK